MTKMNLTLLEESGCVYVFIEKRGDGPKLHRWAGHYTDRNCAWDHMEGLGLLAPTTAQTLRRAVLGVPICMPTCVVDRKHTLSAFFGSQVTVNH